MSSKVKRASVEFIKLYCDCRLPGSYDDIVVCDRCGRWFHYRCVCFVISRAGDYSCVVAAHTGSDTALLCNYFAGQSKDS